jgi:hypothetical protein
MLGWALTTGGADLVISGTAVAGGAPVGPYILLANDAHWTPRHHKKQRGGPLALLISLGGWYAALYGA